MGRRALPKIDNELPLDSHLLQFDDLPNPWDATALFARDAPLEIEVGTGKGLFLSTAAEALAGHNFLGIEVARKYATFAAWQLAQRELSNARVVCGDALQVFRELVPDGSLFAVHVYFPDPWWKRRHRKRRVLNEPFIRDIERTLQPGGKLHFWTDVREYFETSLRLIKRVSRLEGPFDIQQQPPEHDMDYLTNFERRKRMLGLPIYRSEYRKAIA